MSFTAILVLQATPFQLGVLNALQLLPAFLVGLFVGAWVDRVRRRPLMVGVDIGRALLLASIPLAALVDLLSIGQVYVVVLLVSILTILFDVAYRSYLPGLVGKEDILEGNSKLSASAAVAEFGGFSLGGWLVQAFTAPLAVLIDAGSFVVSAVSLGLIQAEEPEVRLEERSHLRQEIVEGLQAVRQHPQLRSIALVILVQSLAIELYGALVTLYMSRGLGFNPGLLGMIWAVGGISSFLGAVFAPRITRRLGEGRTMVLGLAGFGASLLLIPLASGSTLLSVVLLVGQQMGDGFFVIYEINQISLRQIVASERLLGRVNATMQSLALGAALAGSLLGGLLGEMLGVRLALFIGAAGTLLAALAAIPLAKYKTTL
jgi:MFS family permease